MTGYEKYNASQVNTTDQITDILCDIQRTSSQNMGNNITYMFDEDAARITTAGGVATDGVLLYNGLAQGDVDAVYNEVYTMDLCLEHTSRQGFMHHHSVSPCGGSENTVSSTTTKPGACPTNGTKCLDGGYMYRGWSNESYGGVWGLAKDGHVIYGPYNDKGELWNCDDVDICNGFTDSDGSYSYASTTFFPYLVGCWGPGPVYHAGVETSCSENAC